MACKSISIASMRLNPKCASYGDGRNLSRCQDGMAVFDHSDWYRGGFFELRNGYLDGAFHSLYLDES